MKTLIPRATRLEPLPFYISISIFHFATAKFIISFENLILEIVNGASASLVPSLIHSYIFLITLFDGILSRKNEKF